MKIALALTAATVLVTPAAALAQSYANNYDRRDERPAYDHRVDHRTDNRSDNRERLAGGPAIRAEGRIDAGLGSQAYGRRGALIDTRAGYADRPYAYTARDERFRDRFGVGVVSTGPTYASGYDNGYADAGYVDGAPAYGYDQSVAYGASSPFIAGSYAAALERGYQGGAQTYDSGPAYETTASYTSQSYVASSGGTCGQWTWDPAVGRYVWAC